MRRKIFLFLLAVCLLFSVGSVAAIVIITRTTDDLGRLVRLHEIKGLRQNLIIGLQTAQADLYTVNTPFSPALDKVVQNIQNVEEASQGCLGCHHEPDVLRSIEEVRSRIIDYENDLSEYITASAGSGRIDQLKMEAAATGNMLMTKAEEMSYTAGKKLKDKTEASLHNISRARTVLYITVGLTFFIGLIAALRLSRSVTGPMERLVTATRKIASGELDYRIADQGTDEFGELAGHFNTMSEALQVGYSQLRSEVAAHEAAAEALSRSERFLQTIFDSIRDPFCILERDLAIIKCNTSYAEMKGRKEEELKGLVCHRVLYGRDAVCPDCIVEKTFHSGNPCAKEKSVLTGDNSVRWEEIYTYPIFDAMGRVSHVVEYTRDITERKRAEQALRESKERYELAARGANDGLWDWDLTTDNVYYSPRWVSMLGYEPREIPSTPAAWLERVHPEEREQVRTNINAHINGHTSHLDTEHRILHKDASYRWVLTRGLAVRNDLGVAYRLAGSQTDITERKRAEAQLLHDAFHDALTGLPNRALFMDRLTQVMRAAQRNRDAQFAVLFIDLDRFKVVNDSLGHLVGDKLLIEVGFRIARCLRPDDTVARLGGDEFAILLRDVGGPELAVHVAERVLSELDAPFRVKGNEIYTSASIGIALREEGHLKPEHIIRDADIAMYHAKSRGKACYVAFDASMHEKTVERLKLETDLRQALEQQQFVMHYQPIIDLQTDRIVGVEALIRWNHPERGLVQPLEFIPVAEETGMIVALGEWLMRESCIQVKNWQARFPGDPPLTLSVNVSGRQLAHAQFVERMTAIMQEVGFDPRTLIFEITEGMVIENIQGAVALIKQLQEIGVQFHIDDFGTGYSSLSYLHYFPVNALKIDRTFVSRLGGAEGCQQIVRAILTLAESMNLEVIAEGVELAEQLRHVKEMNCRYGQGFLFARPVDAGGMEAFFGR